MQLPALCGCERATDRQEHYFSRFVVQSLVRRVDGLSMLNSVLEFKSLSNPSFQTALRVYVLTNAYHAIKNTHLSSILSFLNDRHHIRIFKLWEDVIFQSYVNACAIPMIANRNVCFPRRINLSSSSSLGSAHEFHEFLSAFLGASSHDDFPALHTSTSTRY